MKISVVNDINYNLEAVSILITYNEKNNHYDTLKERLMQKYSIPAEKIDAMLKDIKDIYNYVVKKLDIPQDKVDFYFTTVNEEIPTICELIMFSIINKSDEAVESLLRLDVDLENLSTADYINHINKLDIDNDTKFKYALMYCNIEKSYSEILEYVNTTIALLKEKEIELQNIADEFMKITIQDVEKYGERFFSTYDIQMDTSMDIVIGPSIIIPNNLMISAIKQGSEYRYSCMGVCVKDIDELKKQYFISDEGTMSILKALGDKSKFDILKSIKNKEMYGAEIAKMLNVTTATVSHHMSNLYNLSLINVINSNNKINYTLNKETIKELINILDRIFLK